MYYILTNNIENDREHAILDGRSAYLIRIDCSFRQGLPLPSDDIDVPIPFNLYEYTLRGTMTDHLSINDISGPVFSQKTKSFFERLEITNIEYYQLKLIDEFPNGDKEYIIKPKPVEYNNYFIANVVGLVDCIDHEQSILEYFYPPELKNQNEETSLNSRDENNPFAGENPNDIDFITKLVLDETKIDPALKIFRLFDKPDLLVFHESVVKAIRKEKLSGFVFVSVSEYTDVIPDDDEDKREKEEPQQKEVLKEPAKKEVFKEPPKQPDQKDPPPETKKRKFNFFIE
jgi:hypothetical protein